MSGTFRIETLGCKANTYDTALIRQELRRRGWRLAARGEGADLVVVNSCTVTDRADRDSRKAAARAARRGGGAARVVMTGCGAETDPAAMAAAPGVDFVVGNQDKAGLVQHVLAALDLPRERGDAAILGGVAPYERLRARHPEGRSWPPPELAFEAPLDRGHRTRAFVKIQEGCDAFCTFCVIPYARGPSRSLGADAIVAHVAQLCARGVREVVLTGTALGDWGADRPGDGELADLVERLLADTPLTGLRLGSLDPHELTPRLLGLLRAEPRLRPHVHVSLQSPHPRVLKRMKRRYPAAAVVATLEALEDLGRQLRAERGLAGGVYVGMDVIAGFPGEDAAAFGWTLERLSALPWTRLHVFPYSERAGTAATRLDGAVPVAERKRRTRALVALSNERVQARARALIEAAEPVSVLVEGPPKDLGAGWAQGRTVNYYRVAFEAPDPDALVNRTVRVAPQRVELLVRPGVARVRGRLVGASRA